MGGCDNTCSQCAEDRQRQRLEELRKERDEANVRFEQAQAKFRRLLDEMRPKIEVHEHVSPYPWWAFFAWFCGGAVAWEVLGRLFGG